MKEDNSFTYEDAIEELREILQSLQGELTNIELLEEKMKRAGVLLQFCSKKIKDIEVNIEDIISEIERETEE
nr:exodeoxyribonuclease VII small subunit [Saprospiraceae bacterium]